MKEINICRIHLVLIAILIQNSSNVSSFSPTDIKTLLISASRNDACSTVIDSRFNNQVIHRDILKSVWRDSVVSLTIPASKEKTYNLFSSLNEHPTWSPWLQSVQFDRETRLSKWTLKSLGLTVTWDANNTIMDAPNVVQWESLNGFPNKGRVQFTDDCDMRVSGLDSNGYEIYEEVDECSIVPESTLLTLTISYDLPHAGVILLESLGPKGQQFIQQTLLGDLKRFRERLVRDLRDERMESFRRSQIGRNSRKKSDTLSE